MNVADFSKSEQTTLALQQCAAAHMRSARHPLFMPDREVMSNLTLAKLRIHGLIDYLADAALREKLALALAILEYVGAAQEAEMAARKNALAQKVALSDLICTPVGA